MRTVVSILLAATAALAKVTEVSDKNIHEYLGKNVPTIISMYADWCGHCKTFAPTFEAISDEFAHLEDEIQFLRINGDKNRHTARTFDLKYFPTVMYVDGEYTEEINNRDAPFVKSFIKEKIGLTPSAKSNKAPQISREDAENYIVELADDTIMEGIRGKHALVAFTAEWCQHCRRLLPEWEKLARVYAHDDDIVVAKVDCTDMTPAQNLVETLEIEGFPTVFYFPQELTSGSADADPVRYEGGRDVEAFVEFLKKQGASHRNANGQLDDKAGVVFAGTNLESILSQTAGSKYADVYARAIKKFREDEAYLGEEKARLEKLLKSELAPASRDKFQVKHNIISALVDAIGIKHEL